MHLIIAAKKLRTGRRYRSGFSLVEVMVGLGIVGIVFLALYAGQTTGLGMVRMEQEHLRATQILVDKLDALRLFSWDQIEDNNTIPDKFEAYFDPETSSGILYKGTVNFGDAPSDTTYSADMKLVTIVLSWISENGLSHQRQIQTFVAKYGLQNYIY